MLPPFLAWLGSGDHYAHFPRHLITRAQTHPHAAVAHAAREIQEAINYRQEQFSAQIYFFHDNRAKDSSCWRECAPPKKKIRSLQGHFPPIKLTRALFPQRRGKKLCVASFIRLEDSFLTSLLRQAESVPIADLHARPPARDASVSLCSCEFTVK